MEKLYRIMIISFLIWAVISTSALAYYFTLSLEYNKRLVIAESRLEKYKELFIKMNTTLTALNNTLATLNQTYSGVISEYLNTIQMLENKLNRSVAIVVIDYGNGTRDIEKVEFVHGVNDTVFDLLVSVADVKYTYYESYGDVLIECINGVCNQKISQNTGYYWSFYINFQLSQVGAMHAKVVDGDIIIWNYTKLSW